MLARAVTTSPGLGVPCRSPRPTTSTTGRCRGTKPKAQMPTAFMKMPQALLCRMTACQH